MHWTLKTPPTVEPVDLSTAKRQCRIEDDVSLEDALVQGYLQAARSWVEGYTGRPLARQTWQASLEGFPARLWLPMAAPLVSITHVKYYDTANLLTTLSVSVYTTAAFSEPACLSLVDGQAWPALWDRDDAVQLEYVVGPDDPALVEPALLQAILLLVGHWYANRETVVVGTVTAEIAFAVEALCAPHRLFLRPPQW